MTTKHGNAVIVTGASEGIGAVTARELARAGARVVLAVRNPDKARAVCATWTGQTEARRLDLAGLESVRDRRRLGRRHRGPDQQSGRDANP